MALASFWQRLAERWSSWIGDRDLEIGLRKHLNSSGYYGDSARFDRLKLAAVQRPGWLQIYVFVVDVKRVGAPEGDRSKLFGVVRQDERYNRLDVETFTAQHERNAVFQKWSEGLLKTRGVNF